MATARGPDNATSKGKKEWSVFMETDHYNQYVSVACGATRAGVGGGFETVSLSLTHDLLYPEVQSSVTKYPESIATSWVPHLQEAPGNICW